MKILFLFIILLQNTFATKLSSDATQNLFIRLTGVQISVRDAMYLKVKELVVAGKLEEAAATIIEMDNFYKVKLKQFGSWMFTPDQNKDHPLDDLLLTFIGVVRDNEDARTLLTGNFIYAPMSRVYPAGPSLANNLAYEQLEARVNYLNLFKKISPQWTFNPAKTVESAGVLTTRGWGGMYYNGGTNRRAVRGLFNAFMCKDLEEWRDKLLEDSWVRRDVDRLNGGDPSEYQNRCKSCHAPMDAIGGAFIYLDFANNAMTFRDNLKPTYLQNGDVFPNGFIPIDSSWENLATKRHNVEFGWDPKTLSGVGVNELGEMIANSEGFKKCMSIRVVKSLCNKDLNYRSDWVNELATEFGKDNFNLKNLFKRVAINEKCNN